MKFLRALVTSAMLTYPTTILVCFSLIFQEWIEQGLMSHQTNYRSYRGRVFTGQITQPTMSKHWRKIGPRIRLQSHQFHPTVLTIIQQLCSMKQKHTKYTKMNTNKSMHSEMGPVWQNPMQRTVRTAHLNVHMTVHSFSTQYNTEQFW